MIPRVPPASVEAEQSVLGGLMLDGSAYHRVADLLTDADFYRRDHALIFRGITELERKGQPLDAVTLGEWFESNGLSEQVDGGAYLTELASTTPSAANVRAYAEIVADKARLRRAIQVGTELIDGAFDTGGRDTLEIITDATKALGDLTKSKSHVLKSVDDGLSEMVDLMKARMAAGGMVGTSYGIPDMDDMTGGKQPGDLIIIAARPSMGKTTLALQGGMAAGRPLIYSFETKAGKLLARMTAHVGRFPLRWLTHPQDAPDYAFARIVEASKQVRERLSASIYDGRRLNIDQLRANAIREHSINPVSEIIVDHLGYMKVPGKGRSDQEYGEVTKGLKELAIELNIPVVLLMQLNRGVESRADKRPMLSDLREVGAAEEDADVVAMIYRDGYYNPEGHLAARRDASGNMQAGYAEIFLRKNRDGEPGEIWTKAELGEMRFDPAEPQSRSVGSVAINGRSGGVPSRFRQSGQSRSAANEF